MWGMHLLYDPECAEIFTTVVHVSFKLVSNPRITYTRVVAERVYQFRLGTGER